MKGVIKLKFWLFIIGFFLLLLGIFAFRVYRYQNDRLNCGAQGNRCESGFVCKSAVCVLP